MKSIWDESPLNEVDLFKEIEEKQKIDPNRTKMSIFKEISKKYNKILTPDQISFRYNYLIRRQRKLIKQIATGNLPSYIKDIGNISELKIQSETPEESILGTYRYRFTINEFRENNQQILNTNRALYEMIDPYKLVKFIDQQQSLSIRRKGKLTVAHICRKLGQIFDISGSKIEARYYKARKEFKELSDSMNDAKLINSKLPSEIYTKWSEQFKLSESHPLINILSNKIDRLDNKIEELTKRPLVKLSNLISTITNKFLNK